MDNIYVQYAFIAFLVGFAIWYLYGMIRNTFKKDKGGCAKGCGCSSTPSSTKK